MTSLLPTPEPADPVEGQPGHFEHSNWLKASVKALDAGVVHKADTWNDTGNANPAFVPSKTANGYPYAKPSDPIVDWPATSQQLAQKLEDSVPRVASGNVQAAGDGTITITYPPGRFQTIPGLTITPVGAPVVVYITDNRTTGATAIMKNPDGTAHGLVNVFWIAVQNY